MSTIDHSQLANRNIPNQHLAKSITYGGTALNVVLDKIKADIATRPTSTEVATGYYNRAEIDAQMVGKAGTDHSQLANRDAPNQHMASAISYGGAALSTTLDTIRSDISGKANASDVTDRLLQKADKNHSHSLDSIQDLDVALDAKSDDAEIKALLAEKANNSDVSDALTTLSPKVHGHTIPDILNLGDELNNRVTTTTLDTELAKKVDKDDPRLTDTRPPQNHNHTHHQNGTDRLTPEDIGALRPPDADGKRYLITGCGYEEYISPSITNSHADLTDRDAPDQHPQTAIQGLSSDLSILANRITTVESTVSGKTSIEYGTTDLTPGTSALETGKVYLVYE